MSNDLKKGIEQLVVEIYRVDGDKFIECAPSNKLSKIFEIVNKKKKEEADGNNSNIGIHIKL
jgi:hypothetical protein